MFVFFLLELSTCFFFLRCLLLTPPPAALAFVFPHTFLLKQLFTPNSGLNVTKYLMSAGFASAVLINVKCL